MKRNHHLLPYFIYTSAILGFTAAIAPDKLNIPTNLRPWVFLASIAWAVAVLSGVFTA
ncbi:MAG TPA: hypothetical protein PKE35_02145 [Anaerolineales bacterium]|nr:hypothetical protein [Anaerolineales bacterium]HMX17993.1 hypothetical protein [Anaerolineales bacterium]HMX73020.1 hypothetical protein [Anaerolineales bacterium]HMZ41674.1 hypothetical protein [Anaerolineales bacterium]HNA53232.1 hypothetical protein [Anaerolineales bacterium]